MKIKFKHTFELLVNDGYRNIPTIVEEGSTWTIDSIRDIGETKGHLFMVDRGHTQFLISDYNMELIKDE